MEKAEKFNEWMKKIHNIHYADHRKMESAFNKIIQSQEK